MKTASLNKRNKCAQIQGLSLVGTRNEELGLARNQIEESTRGSLCEAGSNTNQSDAYYREEVYTATFNSCVDVQCPRPLRVHERFPSARNACCCRVANDPARLSGASGSSSGPVTCTLMTRVCRRGRAGGAAERPTTTELPAELQALRGVPCHIGSCPPSRGNPVAPSYLHCYNSFWLASVRDCLRSFLGT